MFKCSNSPVVGQLPDDLKTIFQMKAIGSTLTVYISDIQTQPCLSMLQSIPFNFCIQ